MKLLSITSGIKFNPALVTAVVFLPKELKTIVSLSDGLKIVSDYDFKLTCKIVENELSVAEANVLKLKEELSSQEVTDVDTDPKTAGDDAKT